MILTLTAAKSGLSPCVSKSPAAITPVPPVASRCWHISLLPKR